MKKKKISALVLFSGGLDSLIAVKLLQEQGVAVHALCFFSNFFGCSAAKKAASVNGVIIREEDISEEVLELVKDPTAKKGRNLNPCIDCHALMVEKAKKYVESGEYDILATGEVLGQRPFSQTASAMRQVEERAGTEVLRPLSAKYLPPTEAEKKGYVDRERLSDIKGRSRKRQVEFAIKYNLREYESPAGGCLLTESEFTRKLQKMLQYWPECDGRDVDLLKRGRPIWFTLEDKEGRQRKILAVVGRKDEDNICLNYGRLKGDALVYLEDIPAPLTLVRDKEKRLQTEEEGISGLRVPERMVTGDLEEEIYTEEIKMFRDAARLTAWYKPAVRGSTADIKIQRI